MLIKLIKLFIGLLIGGLLFSHQSIFAAGAGVLISTQHNNQTFVLLADHKDASQISRGWSTLGGTIKYNETELAAAIREVVEESNGVITAEELTKAIDPNIKTTTAGFVIFYANLPFRTIQRFNQPRPSGLAVSNERGPYIWLPWSEVLKAGQSYQAQLHRSSKPVVRLAQNWLPVESQTDWFFNAFLATIDSISQTPATPVQSFESRL